MKDSLAVGRALNLALQGLQEPQPRPARKEGVLAAIRRVMTLSHPTVLPP